MELTAGKQQPDTQKRKNYIARDRRKEAGMRKGVKEEGEVLDEVGILTWPSFSSSFPRLSPPFFSFLPSSCSVTTH